MVCSCYIIVIVLPPVFKMCNALALPYNPNLCFEAVRASAPIILCTKRATIFKKKETDWTLQMRYRATVMP